MRSVVLFCGDGVLLAGAHRANRPMIVPTERQGCGGGCKPPSTLFETTSAANHVLLFRESVSIPKNPRTDKPVGYAFVDLSTPSEAERAINELSGQEILERKVSVQLARKPESNDKNEAGAAGEGSGGEGTRRRPSGRGRGRGRGRGGRGGRGVSQHADGKSGHESR